MKLQTIRSINGADEYILVPAKVYKRLDVNTRRAITRASRRVNANDQYHVFNPAEYVDQPVVLARLRAGVSQIDLAARLGVGLSVLKRVEAKSLCAATFLDAVRRVLRDK